MFFYQNKNLNFGFPQIKKNIYIYSEHYKKENPPSQIFAEPSLSPVLYNFEKQKNIKNVRLRTIIKIAALMS